MKKEPQDRMSYININDSHFNYNINNTSTDNNNYNDTHNNAVDNISRKNDFFSQTDLHPTTQETAVTSGFSIRPRVEREDSLEQYMRHSPKHEC